MASRDASGRFIKGHKSLAFKGMNKGKHSSPSTEFKKGSVPHNKGLKRWWNAPSFEKGHIPWNKDKGTILDKNEIQRHREDYKLWRKAVFTRDNFTCQKYGMRGGVLKAHHINNFADFPELRLAIDNGITLSDKAHIEFHKLYGRRNNTEEQLEEFLGGRNE